MTTSPIPRLLQLLMLPVFAAAAFMIDLQLGIWLADFAIARELDFFSSALLLLDAPIAAIASACLLAYPLARLYEREWGLACLGVLLFVAAFYIRAFDESGRFLEEMIGPGVLAIFMPALAYGAHRAMHGSRLVDAGASDPTPAPLTRPIALELLLLLVFVIAMFALWGFWLPVLKSIPLGDTPTGRHATLACIRSVGPALLGLALAYPIARCYGRRALLAGFVVTLPTVAWRTWLHLQDEGTAFVVATRAMEMTSLAVTLPLAAWILARRFKDSRLAIRQA